MPDAATVSQVPVADEDRLAAAVARLRQNIVDAYQFRPTDEAKMPAFNQFLNDLLETLIETTSAAAVDKAKIIVTKDLSALRQQTQTAAMQLQAQADIDNRKIGADVAASLLTIARGA